MTSKEILGRYLFNIKASGPGQGLRPLRDPDAVEYDEASRPPTEAGCQPAGTSTASYCSTPQGSTTQDSRNQSL
jgi:hypothetical protein